VLAERVGRRHRLLETRQTDPRQRRGTVRELVHRPTGRRPTRSLLRRQRWRARRCPVGGTRRTLEGVRPSRSALAPKRFRRGREPRPTGMARRSGQCPLSGAGAGPVGLAGRPATGGSGVHRRHSRLLRRGPPPAIAAGRHRCAHRCTSNRGCEGVQREQLHRPVEVQRPVGVSCRGSAYGSACFGQRRLKRPNRPARTHRTDRPTCFNPAFLSATKSTISIGG
jgi:hypothetical protein